MPKVYPFTHLQRQRTPAQPAHWRPRHHSNSTAPSITLPHSGRPPAVNTAAHDRRSGSQGALDSGGILLDTPRIWRGGTANGHTEVLLHFTRPGVSPANEEDLPKYEKVGGHCYVISSLFLLHSGLPFVAIGPGRLHLTLCMLCELFGTPNPGLSHDLRRRGGGRLFARCCFMIEIVPLAMLRSVRQEAWSPAAGHGKSSLRPAHSQPPAVCRTGYASTWRSPTHPVLLRAS